MFWMSVLIFTVWCAACWDEKPTTFLQLLMWITRMAPWRTTHCICEHGRVSMCALLKWHKWQMWQKIPVYFSWGKCICVRGCVCVRVYSVCPGLECSKVQMQGITIAFMSLQDELPPAAVCHYVLYGCVFARPSVRLSYTHHCKTVTLYRMHSILYFPAISGTLCWNIIWKTSRGLL